MPRPSPTARPLGACEQEPAPPVLVHPVPCLPPGPKGTRGHGPGPQHGRRHAVRDSPCSIPAPIRAVPWVHHPGPRPREPQSWGWHRMGSPHPSAQLSPIPARSRRFVCTGLMTPAQTPRCSRPGAPAPGLARKHPPPPWSFSPPSSPSWEGRGGEEEPPCGPSVLWHCGMGMGPETGPGMGPGPGMGTVLEGAFRHKPPGTA